MERGENFLIFENIKAKCKEAGVTIATLETECNLGKKTVYKWQNSVPNVMTLKIVADYFGCTIEDLIKEEE